MNLYGFEMGRVVAGALGGICLSVMLCAQTGHGRGLSGFYTVVRTTELESGSKVELHLRLQLSNAGSRQASARIVGFENDGPATQRVSSDSHSIDIPSRQSETVLRDLVVSRKQFDRWMADSRHRLIVEVESPESTGATVALAMRRIAGGNEE